MNRGDLPIGVLDSGIGGLAVVRALRRILPGETIIYLGDTARVPYGDKSVDSIVRFALEDLLRVRPARLEGALAETLDRGLTVVAKGRDNRKRIALVIGNSSYRSSPLKNPANDARAMALTLRRLGFEVEEKTDLNYLELNKTVENFGKKLRSGGVGLFYYAGHGMQVNGANYLIPVDAEIDDENEVRFKAVDAGLVLAKMEQARSDVNIVVLDACRDNPFSRSFRSTNHGLASMDAPNGTFIAYATAPGKTAADGDGQNGLYTAELIKVLETSSLPLEQVFKRTLKAVREKSGSRQTPWVASNLEGDFFFIEPSTLTDLQPSPVQPTPISPTAMPAALPTAIPAVVPAVALVPPPPPDPGKKYILITTPHHLLVPVSWSRCCV